MARCSMRHTRTRTPQGKRQPLRQLPASFLATSDSALAASPCSSSSNSSSERASRRRAAPCSLASSLLATALSPRVQLSLTLRSMLRPSSSSITSRQRRYALKEPSKSAGRTTSSSRTPASREARWPGTQPSRYLSTAAMLLARGSLISSCWRITVARPAAALSPAVHVVKSMKVRSRIWSSSRPVSSCGRLRSGSPAAVLAGLPTAPPASPFFPDTDTPLPVVKLLSASSSSSLAAAMRARAAAATSGVLAVR
mmetsp:Transcript_17252/g.37222  ORF Transcript_17252/g.37222 Transcript_17252/m.37222 type:complete len:254 (+) Transcript_17252:90-851(+)